MSSVAPSTRRLFLALWPGDFERHLLAELARAISGERASRPASFHLTLVFLGATSVERLACYEQSLSDFTMPLLTLSLDRFGYWPKPRILWLGSSSPLPLLEEVVMDLHRRLQTCGFVPEKRPFSPHITLARKFSGPAPDGPVREPIQWTVNQVVLAESLRQADGTHYRVLARWPRG
jgi:2'-5' RNA ligase